MRVFDFSVETLGGLMEVEIVVEIVVEVEIMVNKEDNVNVLMLLGCTD